jgi:hypothetical protein
MLLINSRKPEKGGILIKIINDQSFKTKGCGESRSPQIEVANNSQVLAKPTAEA